MNEISNGILNDERERIISQIYYLKRKQDLIEKFMTDYPNATINETRGFLAWIEHSALPYSEILFNLRLK